LKKPQALIGLLAALGTAIGVMVAVIGLPYGRADYSAFAEVYHGTQNAGGTVHMVVDTDVTTAATEANTVVAVPGPATVAADVTIHNELGASTMVAAVNFNLTGDSTNTRIVAVTPGACAPPGTSCNPDFSETGLPGAGWSCTPPNPDDDTDNNPANGSESFISCSNASDPPSIANGGTADVARVTYTVMGGLGIAPLTLNTVNVADELGVELLACNPGPGPCFDGSFEFVPPPPATDTPTQAPTNTSTPVPPTNTPTNTPTATNTPAGYGVVKVPESCLPTPDPDNCVPGAPSAANLWICEAAGPACTGVGEGELKVYEVAQGVPTAAAPATGGLAAYEFSVEYDNFVIKSLNPCDIVFGVGGAGAGRGPVDELNSSTPANSDCADDVNGSTDGTCSMSAILENIIHFGCATNGTSPDGPTGTFTLASLVLIPHEDLSNDLFPGNDNGVVTIIKDNGCELVDELGHPLPGSVGGGLAAYCEDAVITVRILEGDLDLDCIVEVTDAQAIAGHYGAFFGSLLYSKWLDLEPNLHDLDIDIKDIQKVFGRIGSTCQNPVPAQTPVTDFSPNS
jgi:hypothetical protein